MAISDETLRAMIRDFHGFEISDDEMDLVRPAIEGYLAEVDKLKDLDLSGAMSSRLLHPGEDTASHPKRRGES